MREAEIKRRRSNGGDKRRGGGRFNGAALARAPSVVPGGFDRIRGGDELHRGGKVRLRLDASKIASGGVISTRRLFGSVESAEPNAAFLSWISNLGGVTAPGPLTNASVTSFSGGVVNDGGGGESVSRRHYCACVCVGKS